MANIAVLGSGGWGIALAITAVGCGNTATLWTPFENEASELLKNRESALLGGVKLPCGIAVTTDITVARGVDMVIIATPSFAVVETVKKLAEVGDIKLLVNVSKGLHAETGDCFSTVINTLLPNTDFVALSGPSHAEEVARKEPTSLVAASKSLAAARLVQDTLMCETLRIYTGDDVTGVELGGAFKNIIAVAAGICDGTGLGDNPKAALMTRGLSEIARLGVKLGARKETFAGLTGLGDLIVTCTSRHSRNHRFGDLVGKGVSVETALQEVGTVEGYHAAKLAKLLADREEVEMPIVSAVYDLLYNGDDVASIVKRLMTRPSKDEYEISWLTNIQ